MWSCGSLVVSLMRDQVVGRLAVRHEQQRRDDEPMREPALALNLERREILASLN
jgi:hypothetical protein